MGSTVVVSFRCLSIFDSGLPFFFSLPGSQCQDAFYFLSAPAMYSSRRAPCINDNASAEQESRVSCVWSRDVKQPPVSRRSAADITLYSYLYTIFFC